MERAIIISNGRSGSTLLSDLIVEEPQTCSAQEYFMSLAPWNRSTELITGHEFWNVLSEPKEELSVLFRIGAPPKEIRYPAHGRFAADLASLPRILAVTLPALTEDPDALFDSLAEPVKRFPAQRVGAHHRAFLDLLAEKTGKQRWVERSGGSSQITTSLLENFPTAKFVYLTRDWAATAKSMSRHSSFQIVQLRLEAMARYGVDPLTADPGDDVPAELAEFLPGRLTAETLRRRGDDQRLFLGLCAFMSSQADQALADHPPAQLHRMAYEQLVADPIGELTTLGEFLGFADPAAWAASVAGRVRTTSSMAVVA
ncbi:sulfotransferase [Actinoplanes sp. KI2]|uniref:sulfotransferase n=1 Tax=Actinoplanes sp. KI2 TaxID=2983315 RepID=UPI0021D5A55E|nr:sulfotransferase [Actinoplanes sp. KI2]MCU7723981.1 sulfotransferase [Actinoplanes sp. KI2]